MRTVAIRGISSYEQKFRKSQLPKDDPGYAPLYMGSYNSMGREKMKAQKKSGWYKNAKDGDMKTSPASRKMGKMKKPFQKGGKKMQP